MNFIVFCRPYWSESDNYTKTNTYITTSDSGYFDWTNSEVSRSSSYHSPTSRIWSDYDLCERDDEDQENNNFMVSWRYYTIKIKIHILNEVNYNILW